MPNIIPLFQLILALGWALAYLVGVVIAIILLVRRRTAGRWIMLAAFFLGLLASICNQVGFRALTDPQLRLFGRIGYRGVTALNFLGGCGGILAVVAIALAIWLLAREKPVAVTEEEAGDTGETTAIPHATKPVSGADDGA